MSRNVGSDVTEEQCRCGGTVTLTDVALVCAGTDSVSQEVQTDLKTTGIREWGAGQCG